MLVLKTSASVEQLSRSGDRPGAPKQRSRVPGEWCWREQESAAGSRHTSDPLENWRE